MLHNSQGNVAILIKTFVCGNNTQESLERVQAFKGLANRSTDFQHPPLSFQGDAERQVGGPFWLGQVIEGILDSTFGIVSYFGHFGRTLAPSYLLL